MNTDFDLNEADTCRKYVTPKLREAGWENPPYSLTEQRYFTDGRIIVIAGTSKRGKGKKADYILRNRNDFPIAVVVSQLFLTAKYLIFHL